MRVKDKRLNFEQGFCPTCGVDLQVQRVIGYEIPGLYDGVLFWKCTNCNIYHFRFNKSPLRKKEFDEYVKNKLEDRGITR